MSAARDATRFLDADPESTKVLRAMLDHVGYDVAQQWLRRDYFTSPFPHYEAFAAAIGGLSEPLAAALRLLSLALPVAAGELERALGRDFVEAGLATGLLTYEVEDDTFATAGLSVVSQLGQFFVVSTNPYYPDFRAGQAGVYLGPDSFALARHLQRLAPALPAAGAALDLCAGSGIAGQGLAGRNPEQCWRAVDLAPEAVAAARLNAALNGVAGRHQAGQGDLFAVAGDARFDLIVCNPPFIPVPDGCAFPLYGNGGEDGMGVVRPLLDHIGRHLTERGRAVAYTEGLGDASGPYMLGLLKDIAHRDKLDAHVTIVARSTAEQALHAVGLLLARQRPSRLDELTHWKTSFDRQGAGNYYKSFLEVHHGRGSVAVTWVVRAI